LGEYNTALRIYNLLDLLTNNWRSEKRLAANLYSQMESKINLTQELELLQELKLLSGKQLTIPTYWLRFAIRNQNRKEAESIFQQISKSLDLLSKDNRISADSIYTIQIYYVRTNLLMAKLYSDKPKVAKSYIDKALDKLKFLPKRNYDFILSDQDFDAARGEEAFQQFLIRNNLGYRLSISQRVDSNLDSSLIFGFKSQEEARELCERFFQNRFDIRCASVRRQSIAGKFIVQLIVERDSTLALADPEEEASRLQRAVCRLVNLAILQSHLSDNELLERIIQGEFGKLAQIKLAEFGLVGFGSKNSN
ncbi:MAG: hypothetical protein AAGA30_05640, partial [Planctomycetota bacterium]